MKMCRAERNLKIVAYVVSCIFALLILLPLVYILSNSVKDTVKIYEMPPRLIPDSAQSISIIMDYSKDRDMDKETLLDTISKDSILAMFSTVYELDKESIFEIKFYGTMGDKTVFYSRAHKLRLQLEMDYGVYASSVVKNEVLLYGDRYQRALNSLGFSFDIDGLDKAFEADKIGENPLNINVKEYLQQKYEVTGAFTGTTLARNNFLMLESYKYYYELPSFVYKEQPAVKKFSFLVFIFNTLIIISWAIISQVSIGSVTAFGLSRLMKKRTSNIIIMYFLATLMIPFVSIMIPQFIMFKSLGFYNNYAALLVPFLLPFGFYVYLFKGFFDRLPGSLFEAAKIDGASNFYCYIQICLPLSKPIIALIALQTFLGNWNDFFWAWMVTEKQSLWTLNVALYNLSNNNAIKQNFIMGLSIVTILPVILLTVIFSDQIKQSIASTGIKG